MNTLRTIFAAAAILTAASAFAAPQSLQSESGGTGQVVITSGNSATITNTAPGDYGLVITNANLKKFVKGKTSCKPLSVVDYSFVSSGAVAGGAPRFSIPIDTNGDCAEDGFAFIDVNSCNGASLVSTESSTCKVYFGSQVFDNWDAFAAANPTYSALGWAFIISDQPGNYVLSNIDVK